MSATWVQKILPNSSKIFTLVISPLNCPTKQDILEPSIPSSLQKLYTTKLKYYKCNLCSIRHNQWENLVLKCVCPHILLFWPSIKIDSCCLAKQRIPISEAMHSSFFVHTYYMLLHISTNSLANSLVFIILSFTG